MPIEYQIFPVHVKERISFFFFCFFICKVLLDTKLATYRSFNPFIINLLRGSEKTRNRCWKRALDEFKWTKNNRLAGFFLVATIVWAVGNVAHIRLFEIDRGRRWENSLNSMKSIRNKLFCWSISWLDGWLAGWLGSRLKSNAKVIKIDRNNNQLICVPCAACSVGLRCCILLTSCLTIYKIECVCIVVDAMQNVKQKISN